MEVRDLKRIAILGSTGSIGTQTLDVIDQHRDMMCVESIAGGYNLPLLIEQIHRFQPKHVSVANKTLAEQLKHQIPSSIQVYYGEEGLLEIAGHTQADILVTALVGSQGLKPTLAGIQSGKHIGLANKETLVTAGEIVTSLAREKGVSLLPIDSEHSAIFQCIHGEKLREVNKIILTASGGSFRDKSRDQLSDVTVDQALQHPNWAMGAKITIDSATMVNKGLEVIEAHWLFGLDYKHIEVIIHPESIVHSLVEFIDYSVLAQLGNPDMRLPIQYALTYPNRIPLSTKPLRLAEVGNLHFKEMDVLRYPCLKMAYECGMKSGSYPTVFNAANEIAVARFLSSEIKFLQIEDIIEQTLSAHDPIKHLTIDSIDEMDSWARSYAQNVKFSS
jgi:1-deoxy-D-xylulose-5-phosphate reductoisomerase